MQRGQQSTVTALHVVVKGQKRHFTKPQVWAGISTSYSTALSPRLRSIPYSMSNERLAGLDSHDWNNSLFRSSSIFRKIGAESLITLIIAVPSFPRGSLYIPGTAALIEAAAGAPKDPSIA